MWDFTTIKEILTNPVYVGAIASQKADWRFKIGWMGDKKAEDWIVVENIREWFYRPYPLFNRRSSGSDATVLRKRHCAA